MFFRSIQIPVILQVGRNLLQEFDAILRKNSLLFENRVLVTTAHIYQIYREEIEHLKCARHFLITTSDVEEVHALEKQCTDTSALILGFGGGKVIDVVKLFADRANLPYISLPSTLSHDGIYSPVARLTDNGLKRSFGVKPPLGIIADLNVIQKAPEITLLAGVGDLVSNLSALKDWKLANIKVGEPINDFAYSLSMLAASSVIDYQKRDLHTKDFLQKLAYGLVISGLAMVIAGNSRPASGAEHLISHTIDQYFPQRSTLHGLQVAWGHMLVERRLRRNEPERIETFFNNIGLLQAIDERIRFSESEIEFLLEKSLTIRNRYTVLNEAHQAGSVS